MDQTTKREVRSGPCALPAKAYGSGPQRALVWRWEMISNMVAIISGKTLVFYNIVGP